MNTKFICMFITVFSIISFGDSLTGTWHEIGWFEEGEYNGQYFRDSTYYDTITYVMNIYNDTCEAYFANSNRIYRSIHKFEFVNDSIYSDVLSTPLHITVRNDTLISTAFDSSGQNWEVNSLLFVKVPYLNFPGNWPIMDTIFIPTLLTPFGLFFLSIRPDDPFVSIITVNPMVQVRKTNKTKMIFTVNGRMIDITNRNRGVSNCLYFIQDESGKVKKALNIKRCWKRLSVLIFSFNNSSTTKRFYIILTDAAYDSMTSRFFPLRNAESIEFYCYKNKEI